MHKNNAGEQGFRLKVYLFVKISVLFIKNMLLFASLAALNVLRLLKTIIIKLEGSHYASQSNSKNYC